MKRKDLHRRLIKIGLSGRQAEAAVDAFFGSLVDALRDGRKVSIVGLGTWEWRIRRPRLARNPKTGQKVPLGSRKVLLFRPSFGFKKNLKNKG
jgi:nucleoid DNA-binding protein